MANLTDVTDATFRAEVLESEQPVLVDFWADWCAPCRTIAPILEQIAADRDDLRIVKVNWDQNQQTGESCDVRSLPTLILFRGGVEAKRFNGAMPRKRLEAEIEPALS